MQTITNPDNGQVVNQYYPGTTQVYTQKDPAGLLATWVYTGNAFSTSGGSTTITGSHGQVEEQDYANGELMSLTEQPDTPEARTWTYLYDPSTLGLTSVTDPLGNTTTYSYDSDGNVTTETDPIEHETSWTYNGFNEPLTEQDPAGVDTTWTYDKHGNLQQETVVGAGGSPTVTSNYYDQDPSLPGYPTKVVDPDDHETDYGYDAYGDVVSTTSHPSASESDTSTAAFDVMGREYCSVSAAEAAKGVVCPSVETTRVADTQSWTYNADGEVSTSTDPDGKVTQTLYNGDGKVILSVDPSSNETLTTYDSDDRPTRVFVGLGSPAQTSTLATYDVAPGTGLCSTSVVGAAYCSTSTDGLGTTTDYYDVFGELIESQPPDTSAQAPTVNGYDQAGRLTSVTSGSGTATYGLYANGQVQTVTYSGAPSGTAPTPSVSYTYWPDGQVKTMGDGTGTSSYGYDGLQRLTSQQDGSGASVTYGYDADGNVTCMSYPVSGAASCPASSGTGIVTYGYDGAGQMSSLSDWQGHTTQFGFDPSGNEQQAQLPNGLTSTLSYDPSGLLTGISDAPSGSPNSPVVSFGYSYPAPSADPLVSEATQSGVPGVPAVNYAYNAASQLSAATTGAFAYDSAQDPTTVPGIGGLAYNSDHQLCWSGPTSGSCMAAPPGATTYGYNTAGDRTSAAGPAGGSTSFGYDQANRLVSASQSPSEGHLALGNSQTVEVRPDGTVWGWGTFPGNGSPTSPVPVPIPDLSNIVSAAAGLQTAYALSSSGVVYAWGYGAAGQAGPNCTSTCSTPVVVSGLPSDVTAIAAGAVAGYAVTAAGQVYAWGDNSSGELGANCSTSTCATPVQVAGLPSGVTQISAGGVWWDSTYALTGSGEVYAWGMNNAGQLGTGCTTSSCSTPVVVAGLPSDVTQISAGGWHALAATADGTVYGWGENANNQLGAGCTTSSCSTPVAVTGLGGPATAISATEADSYAVVGGIVKGWGDISQHQLGRLGGGSTPADVGTLFGGTLGVGPVAQDMALIESDGSTVAWGLNSTGQVGDNSTTNVGDPVTLWALGCPLAEGVGDTLAVQPDGSVWAWGSNTAGEVGSGCSGSSCLTPVQVPGLSDVATVASGLDTSYALESNGTLYAWGDNSSGGLGNGSTINSTTPVAVQLPTRTDVVAVAAGFEFAAALTSTGTVYAWGSNAQGQLGTGCTTSSCTTPVAVAGLPAGVDGLTATGTAGLALTSAGTVYGWGDGSEGQLGTSCAKPVQIAGLSGITDLAGVGSTVVADTASDTVETLGYSGGGQAGPNCTTTTCSTPVVVPNVSAPNVAAGLGSLYAYGPSDGVTGWGDNTNDQLTSACHASTCATPVTIDGLYATSMATGTFGNSPAIETQATVFDPTGVADWGNNSTGQLGNGTTTNAATEVMPTTLVAPRAIAAATYTYNGAGLLTQEVANGTTEHLVWGSNLTGQPLLLQYGSNDLIYGPGGTPVEELDGGTTPLYYLTDGQGSIRAQTDQTGTIQDTYTYSPTGALQEVTGQLTDIGDNPLGYTGGYSDLYTGLTYLINRWYDPTTAQFTTVDPAVAATGTPYAYAGNDPVNGSDPLGLCNQQGNGNAWDLVNPWSSNNPIRCSVEKNPNSTTTRILEANPAYQAVNGYYNEWQATENGCGLGTELSYGAQGVLGVVGTVGIAAGGASLAEGLLGSAADEGANSITGFTQHGLEQALGRDGGVGVSDSAMADAVTNPVEVEEQTGGRTLYVGTNATVVLNSDGEVITTWANNSAGWRSVP